MPSIFEQLDEKLKRIDKDYKLQYDEQTRICTVTVTIDGIPHATTLEGKLQAMAKVVGKFKV